MRILLSGTKDTDNVYYAIKSFLDLLSEEKTEIVFGDHFNFGKLVQHNLKNTNFGSKIHHTIIDDIIEDNNLEFEIDYLVVFYDKQEFDSLHMRTLSSRAAKRGISTLFICYGESKDKIEFCCNTFEDIYSKHPSLIEPSWKFCPYCGDEISPSNLESSDMSETTNPAVRGFDPPFCYLTNSPLIPDPHIVEKISDSFSLSCTHASQAEKVYEVKLPGLTNESLIHRDPQKLYPYTACGNSIVGIPVENIDVPSSTIGLSLDDVDFKTEFLLETSDGKNHPFKDYIYTGELNVTKVKKHICK